jgi:hypothetical protein
MAVSGSSSEHSQRIAQQAGAGLFLGLSLLVVVFFSFLGGNDYYFNLTMLRVFTAAIVVACVPLGVIVWRTRGREPAVGRSADDRNRVGSYGSLAACVPLLVCALMFLLVFLTSHEPRSVTTTMVADGRGRGCRQYFHYYNEPTQRIQSVCRSKLPLGVQSGDRFLLSEEVGPFGARIDSFQKGQ